MYSLSGDKEPKVEEMSRLSIIQEAIKTLNSANNCCLPGCFCCQVNVLELSGVKCLS